MQKFVSDRIGFLCDLLPNKWRQIPEEALQARPKPNRWSKKEILGHLIDSAINNHQRFVRGQLEDTPTIFYNQDQWVSLQNYQNENKEVLITLWENYNRHLAHIIASMPEENLEKKCRGKDGTTVTLSFLAKDYLQHLEHHVKQIIDY